MASQEVLNLVVGLLIGLLAYVGKDQHDGLKDIRKDLEKLREELHVRYVSKDEYREDISELKHILHKISDKLDAKADK